MQGPSRNKPCPCGSGKKYKKCCGNRTDNYKKKKMVDSNPKKIFDVKNFVLDRLEKLIKETKSLQPNDHIIQQLTFHLYQLEQKGNLTNNEYRLIKEVALMNVMEYGQLPFGDTPDYGAMKVFFEFAYQAVMERVTDEQQYYNGTIYVGPGDTLVKWKLSNGPGWPSRENSMNINWQNTSEQVEKNALPMERPIHPGSLRQSQYTFDSGLEEFIAAFLDLISMEIAESPREWYVIDIIGDIRPFSKIDKPTNLENLKEMYLTEVEITLAELNENADSWNFSWDKAKQAVKKPYEFSFYTKLKIVDFILDEVKKYIMKDQSAASKETILLYLTFAKGILINRYAIGQLVNKPFIQLFLDENQHIIDFTITESDQFTNIVISELQKQPTHKKVLNSNHFAAPIRPGDRVHLQFLDSSQQKPDDYVALLDLGIFYKRKGQYEQAKEQYIQAIKANPKHFQAYYNLGKVLYIIGEYKQAVKSYRTALELGYDRIGDVMRHLGHALLDENASEAERHIVMNYLKSIDPFKKLTHKKPTSKEINDYDAKCAAAARQYVELGLVDE